LLPNEDYRTIWQCVKATIKADDASCYMVRILHLASKADDEMRLGRFITNQLNISRLPSLFDCQERFSAKPKDIPQVNVMQDQLSQYQSLLQGGVMNSATGSLPLMIKQLRLSAVTEHWKATADKALHDQWRPEQYLSELCHIELASRNDKRQMRYVKESNLPSGKHLGGFDFTAIEGLNKARMSELAVNHDWIRQGANLLLFGASGVGKTHLASSLGYSLIEAGTRVKFYSASALVQQLQEAKQSLKLQDALNKLDK
jgi:chromosomal replication initiation ATPase DnaA